MLQKRIHVNKSLTYVRQHRSLLLLSPPGEHPEQVYKVKNIDVNSSDTHMILNCR